MSNPEPWDDPEVLRAIGWKRSADYIEDYNTWKAKDKKTSRRYIWFLIIALPVHIALWSLTDWRVLTDIMTYTIVVVAVGYMLVSLKGLCRQYKLYKLANAEIDREEQNLKGLG